MSCEQGCIGRPRPRRYPFTEQGRADAMQRMNMWALVYQCPVKISFDVDTNEIVIEVSR